MIPLKTSQAKTIAPASGQVPHLRLMTHFEIAPGRFVPLATPVISMAASRRPTLTALPRPHIASARARAYPALTREASGGRRSSLLSWPPRQRLSA